MKLSTLRNIYTFANNLGINPRELIDNIGTDYDDFEIDNYRFIKSIAIDEIMQDEMESDPYVLGSYNDWFIADATGWPVNLIKAAQKGGAYAELGEVLIDEGYVKNMQKLCVGCDRYGPHFASYDGDENETSLNGIDYYYFRVN